MHRTLPIALTVALGLTSCAPELSEILDYSEAALEAIAPIVALGAQIGQDIQRVESAARGVAALQAAQSEPPSAPRGVGTPPRSGTALPGAAPPGPLDLPTTLQRLREGDASGAAADLIDATPLLQDPRCVEDFSSVDPSILPTLGRTELQNAARKFTTYTLSDIVARGRSRTLSPLQQVRDSYANTQTSTANLISARQSIEQIIPSTAGGTDAERTQVFLKKTIRPGVVITDLSDIDNLAVGYATYLTNAYFEIILASTIEACLGENVEL